MIRTKNKMITILVLIVLLLTATGFRLFATDSGVTSPNIESIAEVENTNLGGVIASMPDNSAKILFESLLGMKLNSYRAFDTVDETVNALKGNEIQLAWFSDVTARYLLKTVDGLRELKTSDPTNHQLDFALALRTDEVELRDQLNTVLATLKENGTLQQLIDTYVDTDDYSYSYPQSKMKSTSIYKSAKPIYIGVSGAVPPLDLFDVSGEPTGFAVALMDEIGLLLRREVKFVVMKNEAMFSNLMSGKVDAIFCYGTTKSTMVSEKNYIMTDGYYTMNKYTYLVQE